MSHLDKFAPDELAVARYSHWIVTVRGKQVTPGDLVVLPLEPIAHFEDVGPEAAAELLTILGKVERIALGPLSADRVNAVAAMMKDPFIHFHFFPRFEGPVEKFGQTWVDEDWPRAITLRDIETPPDVLDSVKVFYTEHLNDASN